MSTFVKAATALMSTLAIATAIGTVTGTTASNAQSVADAVEIAVDPPPRPPEVGIAAVNATPEQRERLAKAVALFADVGLKLPAIRVHFEDTTDDCNGRAGLYHRTGHRESWRANTIQICDRLLVTVVHELAHAWIYEALGEDRRTALVEIWGLETWGDHDVEWGERGTERAAQAITAAFIIDFRTDNPGILRNVCNFELVTGKSLPDPTLFDCTRS